MSPFSAPFFCATQKREAAAPKPRDCISGGAQDIFGGVSEDLLGGDGANYEQARSDMIRAGYISEQQFGEDVAMLDNSDFLMPSPIMWTVSGRRPNE